MRAGDRSCRLEGCGKEGTISCQTCQLEGQA